MIRKTFAGPAPALVATVLAAVLAAGGASAQTVDELVEKNIQAHGGRDKLKAMQTVRMTGKMTMGPGVETPLTMEMKRPNKARIEFVFQGMTGVQAYDGTAGWMVMPFLGKKEPEAMTAEDLKQMESQSDMEGPLVDYKEKGHQVELIGKEDLEGTPVYKLKVTKKNGDVSFLYLDGEYFLEIKEESKRSVRGQEVETVTTYGDFKPVAGVVLPHSIEAQQKGAPVAQTIAIEKIEVNADVPDSRFAMPKPEKQETAPPQ